MGVHFRVGVFGLNLRLASLVLATIGKLWFWSSRALTGFVYASAGFIQAYGDDDHAGIQNWFSIVLQPSG